LENSKIIGNFKSQGKLREKKINAFCKSQGILIVCNTFLNFAHPSQHSFSKFTKEDWKENKFLLATFATHCPSRLLTLK
jgi:hypothetical protein